jgi:integrase/recombinase XerC
VDVKRTLAHWTNPNTQRVGRAVLVGFYDWTMEEGYRKDNPGRQTRRAKRQPTQVYRLVRDEAVAMLAAAHSTRERRAIYLGICAGLRNAELRGLRGEHFHRPGWIGVSAEIAKGGRQRWLPVIPDLEEVVAEIRANVAADVYVLPAQRFRDPPFNRRHEDLDHRPSSSQALRTLVMRVAQRAGIKAHVHPHLLRHAYGDHIARHAGMRNAQFLLGHAGIATTEAYVGKPTLDELKRSVRDFTYGAFDRTDVLGVSEAPEIPAEATTGIEPVYTALQACWIPRCRLYRAKSARVRCPQIRSDLLSSGHGRGHKAHRADGVRHDHVLIAGR